MRRGYTAVVFVLGCFTLPSLAAAPLGSVEERQNRVRKNSYSVSMEKPRTSREPKPGWSSRQVEETAAPLARFTAHV
jgi:hypothetical protein